MRLHGWYDYTPMVLAHQLPAEQEVTIRIAVLTFEYVRGTYLADVHGASQLLHSSACCIELIPPHLQSSITSLRQFSAGLKTYNEAY